MKHIEKDKTLEELCKLAFNQYLTCISPDKETTICEKQFYEKCSLKFMKKWELIIDEQQELSSSNNASLKSKN